MSLIHKIREIPWFNIPDLDQEHQEIAILIEKMAQKVLNPEKGKIVSQCSLEDIEDVVKVFEGHFRNEELFIMKLGYPNCDQHNKEHIDLLKKIKETMIRQHHLEGGISIGTIFSLNSWIQKHFEDEYQKFVNYFCLEKPKE